MPLCNLHTFWCNYSMLSSRNSNLSQQQIELPLATSLANELFAVCEPSVSSLERSSPLNESRSRSLRSNRCSFGGSSVTVVKMTPLSFLPGTRVVKYLGIINMFFIRETTSLREVRPKWLDSSRPRKIKVATELVLCVLHLYRKAVWVASSIRSLQRCLPWFAPTLQLWGEMPLCLTAWRSVCWWKIPIRTRYTHTKTICTS